MSIARSLSQRRRQICPIGQGRESRILRRQCPIGLTMEVSRCATTGIYLKPYRSGSWCQWQLHVQRFPVRGQPARKVQDRAEQQAWRRTTFSRTGLDFWANRKLASCFTEQQTVALKYAEEALPYFGSNYPQEQATCVTLACIRRRQFGRPTMLSGPAAEFLVDH